MCYINFHCSFSDLLFVVLREIMTVDWDMMNEVDQLPYGKTSADWLDALVVAMDLLHDPE